MSRGHLLAGTGVLFLLAWLGGCGGGGQAARKEFDLTVRGGALPAGQQVIRVGQGDDVVLRWSTSEPIAVHLHGYDIEREIEPGAVATMRFVAAATGRFPITRHGHGKETPLGYLEVLPR